MRTKLKGLIREEKGAALVLTLVLLLIGGLIIAPLLGHMGTGHTAGQVHEKRMDELYAADAGVEDAIWQLKQLIPDPAKVPATQGQDVTYMLGETINDKEVEVTISLLRGGEGTGTYKIKSIGTTPGGSKTTVSAHVQTLPLFWLNAITSTGGVTLQPKTEVYGDVMGELDRNLGYIEGSVGPPYNPNNWPFSNNFSEEYWSQILGDTCPIPLSVERQGNTYYLRVSAQNVVDGYPSFGPGFHEGNLEIVNSGGDLIEAKLTGTVYISGHRSQVNMTSGNADWILDLNYQTIYVEGGYYDLSRPQQYALQIGNRADVRGSGLIIAEGNINFYPNVSAGHDEDDFIFVMSLYGRVNFLPKGTIYGSVAGRDVYLGPGNVITHTAPPFDDEGELLLNFPVAAVESSVMILTWEIETE